MPGEEKLSRRSFLMRAAALGAAAAAAPLALACSGGGGGNRFSCENPPGLQPAERTMRQTLNYIDRTRNPAQNCANCGLYIVAEPGQCGGCELPLGPVHPEGWCSSWVAET